MRSREGYEPVEFVLNYTGHNTFRHGLGNFSNTRYLAAFVLVLALSKVIPHAKRTSANLSAFTHGITAHVRVERRTCSARGINYPPNPISLHVRTEHFTTQVLRESSIINERVEQSVISD